jgi:hypothetical protein
MTYDEYVKNIESGESNIPLIFYIFEIFIKRYGKEHVEMKFYKSNYNVIHSTNNNDSYKSKWFFDIINIPGYDSDMHKNINVIFDLLKIDIEIWTHFPKIDITNSKGHTHVIYDLYFVSKFTINGKLIDDYIRRTTYTVNELKYRYAFSHATGYGTGTNSMFRNQLQLCRGEDGSDMRRIYEIMKLDNYDETTIPYYVNIIEKYLSWESLEGVPYRYIENIYGNQESELTPTITQHDRLLQKIIIELKDVIFKHCTITQSYLPLIGNSEDRLYSSLFNSDTMYGIPYYRIIYNEYEIMNIIVKYMKKVRCGRYADYAGVRSSVWDNVNNLKCKMTKNEFGKIKYYKENNMEIDEIDQESPLFFFGGKPVLPKIVGPNKTVDTNKECITPWVLRAFINRLEYAYNEKYRTKQKTGSYDFT